MLEGILFGSRETVDKADLRAAYRGVFTSPAGRLVLADITASLRRTPLPHQGAEERAFHDGERALALRIVRILITTEEEYGRV